VQGNEKFKQLVNDWQTKLGTVEAVLGCWGDVQKKWQALESIFIGSADIRVQLPEDSKRFDAINADFQDLMRSAPDVTGVVAACNLEGRDERLNNLLSQLEMCEKALQDYLETKRIAFPRFYFVAPADLLDILSKGSNPQLILRHLSKCFDSVCNMEFRRNDKGEPTKAALAMFDPKGEKVCSVHPHPCSTASLHASVSLVVPLSRSAVSSGMQCVACVSRGKRHRAFVQVLFDGECLCDGPVEQWLNSVVDSMKQALHAEYTCAIPAYDNMKRSTEWIYEFSAQNTIVVSRTFFTQEVNEAFEELEEGNEDALKVGASHRVHCALALQVYRMCLGILSRM
jgi:dynein heavy chain, axonemal